MIRTLLALAAGLTVVTADPTCSAGEGVIQNVEIMFTSVEYIRSFKIYLTGDATGGNGAEIRLMPPDSTINDGTATGDTTKFTVDLVQSDAAPTDGRYYYSGAITDGPCVDSDKSGCLQPTDTVNPPIGGPTIKNLLTVPVCFLHDGEQPGPAACVDVKFNEGSEGSPTEFKAASGEVAMSRILEKGGNAVESERCRTIEIGVYEDAQPDSSESEEGEKERGGDDTDGDGSDGDNDDGDNDDGDNDDDDDDLPRPA